MSSIRMKNSEKSKSNNNNVMSLPEDIKILVEIIDGIKERLDIHTSPYLRKSNKYFLDYDKDWSVIWFINKFIITWKWRNDTIDDVMLIEIYEETNDDLFIDLLEYRIISRRIKELEVNKKIEADTIAVDSNLQRDTSGNIISVDDEIEEVYL